MSTSCSPGCRSYESSRVRFSSAGSKCLDGSCSAGAQNRFFWGADVVSVVEQDSHLVLSRDVASGDGCVRGPHGRERQRRRRGGQAGHSLVLEVGGHWRACHWGCHKEGKQCCAVEEDFHAVPLKCCSACASICVMLGRVYVWMCFFFRWGCAVDSRLYVCTSRYMVTVVGGSGLLRPLYCPGCLCPSTYRDMAGFICFLPQAIKCLFPIRKWSRNAAIQP
ncbi:Piso0_004305 [Millerozyma farinosa CBS 7064]|uniref:Piso0_004305 protein n=1 Tax=Pichia sorbitophila (strain ATCC MYA-4447 / BCRC 22081 / CBS 7064 / NBRC 10061 / NRRL Y-12695) TaxID=559304 RepID=G8Y820_PICSO|nr:Piso0_004305 [Millerozyma farinosa CBS 7064]CCE84750.1 Piso0_004305 [Millerozyma farinosa CBS 7064]